MINLLKNNLTFRYFNLSIALMILVITIVGIILLNTLDKLEQESRHIAMNSRTEEYSIKIGNRINASIELLGSMAPFFSSLNTENEKNILKNFYFSNEKNKFYRMGFFSLDNKAYIVRLGDDNYTIKDIALVEPEIQAIVKVSFQGKAALSNVFIENDTHLPSVGFSVPVYNDNKVIGVLVGSYPTNFFKELLNTSTNDNAIDHENVDLIKSNGDLIILSNQSIATANNPKNLFDFNTYTKEQECDILENMSNKKAFECYFKYKGTEYLSKYTPVTIPVAVSNADWYIIYSDTTNLNLDNFYIFFNKIQSLLLILFIVIITISIYLNRKMFFEQRKIEKLAYYDSLTGSFNFSKFNKDLKSSSNIKSLVVINIIRFSYINKAFGKSKSNNFLILVNDIIHKNLTSGEFFCRENADQFWLALDSNDNHTLERRLNIIIAEIELKSEKLYLGYKPKLAVGINSFKKYNLDIFEHTRFALKEAKKKKETAIVFWSDIKEVMSDIHFHVESHKEEALKNGEFQLYLQPKLNFTTQEFDSAEVLIRWIKPDGKMIFPDQFIPHFEENGFCVQLDLYIFEEACKLLRKWIDNNQKVIKLSVNQSKLLFYKSNYSDLLCKITNKYNIDRSLITLEILENLAMEDITKMNEVVIDLQHRGFSISLDDFGSGYSSLNSLGSLKVDEIKLDKIFLKSAIEESKNKIVIEHIIQIAIDMNINVVIEGIETKDDETFIKTTQAQYGQGYYYSRPISINQFEEKYNPQKKIE